MKADKIQYTNRHLKQQCRAAYFLPVWSTFLLLFALWILHFVPGLEAQEKLIYTISLYSAKESGSTLTLSQSDGWVPIAKLGKALFERIPKIVVNSDLSTLRKWRIRASYSQFRTEKKAALEVLLEPKTGKSLVFVLPWKERSFVVRQVDRSNWFIPYTEQDSLLQSEARVSFRVITERGSTAQLELAEVLLEAWDLSVVETQIAAGPGLPNIGEIGQATDDRLIELYRQDALQFSLDFIKYGLNGELPKYYYSQSPTVYGLEDGKGYSVYRWAPPQKDYGDVELDMFVQNYQYKIYAYNEIREIYPEWFAAGRQWRPKPTSYLFVGDQVRIGGVNFVSDNILKFIVEYSKGRWQVIARPLKNPS